MEKNNPSTSLRASRSDEMSGISSMPDLRDDKETVQQQTDFVYDPDSEAYQAMIKEVSGRC